MGEIESQDEKIWFCVSWKKIIVVKAENWLFPISPSSKPESFYMQMESGKRIDNKFLKKYSTGTQLILNIHKEILFWLYFKFSARLLVLCIGAKIWGEVTSDLQREFGKRGKEFEWVRHHPWCQTRSDKLRWIIMVGNSNFLLACLVHKVESCIFQRCIFLSGWVNPFWLSQTSDRILFGTHSMCGEIFNQVDTIFDRATLLFLQANIRKEGTFPILFFNRRGTMGFSSEFWEYFSVLFPWMIGCVKNFRYLSWATVLISCQLSYFSGFVAISVSRVSLQVTKAVISIVSYILSVAMSMIFPGLLRFAQWILMPFVITIIRLFPSPKDGFFNKKRFLHCHCQFWNKGSPGSRLKCCL